MSKNELRSSGERVSAILRMARVNCNKMSIKVGCKSHDMRIEGQIVKVRSTEQSVGIIVTFQLRRIKNVSGDGVCICCLSGEKLFEGSKGAVYFTAIFKCFGKAD